MGVPVAILITVLALVQYMVFAGLVGRARHRFGVQAPATTGNETFERYYRVQMNTIELLVVLIPALWIASTLVPASWVALLGVVYLIGRIVYLRAYVAGARRSLGYNLSALPVAALLLIDLIGGSALLLRALRVWA